MNDPSATILTTVARCRVRMQLVAGARRAGITIPLAIVAVELFAADGKAVAVATTSNRNPSRAAGSRPVAPTPTAALAASMPTTAMCAMRRAMARGLARPCVSAGDMDDAMVACGRGCRGISLLQATATSGTTDGTLPRVLGQTHRSLL